MCFKMIKECLEGYNKFIICISFQRSYCGSGSLFMVSLDKNTQDRIFFILNSLKFKL